MEVITVKEVYTAPEMKVVEFECEDVITTSLIPSFTPGDDINETPLM